MMTSFQFPIEEADTVLMNLLERRETIRRQVDFHLHEDEFLSKSGLDSEWIVNSLKAYRWATRTPLAIVLCGLLARSVSSDVDPFSLLQGSGDFGYNATGLWAVVQKHAEGRIFLRHLKDQPFNNSPFSGKRRLSTEWKNEWENVSAKNIGPIGDAHKMLCAVEKMDPKQAESALLSFLVAIDDIPAPVSVTPPPGANPAASSLTLIDFCGAVVDFMHLNPDDGRRAQAFVAACVEVAMPNRTVSPASVNDPSRKYPGDVRTHYVGDPSTMGPLFVEVKYKYVSAGDVQRFVNEVRKYQPNASVGYAAFANSETAERSKPESTRVGTSDQLTQKLGLPVQVWKSPLSLVAHLITWSGLGTSDVIAQVAYNYRKWLRHIDTGSKAASPEEWDKLMCDWGMPLE